MGADLLACGDKFLVAGRGTRYQRPKNARAASVLIYANPSTGLQAALKKVPLDSVLKHEGHRSTTVESPDQLSAILASGRFDVVLVASGDAAVVEKLLGGGPDAPVVVALCVKAAGQEQPASDQGASCLKTPPKEGSLLEAIDKAVDRHDQNARKAQTRT
jgi:DNA-binding NtrC family response regulator